MNYLPGACDPGQGRRAGQFAGLLQWASPLAGFVFLAVCLRVFAVRRAALQSSTGQLSIGWHGGRTDDAHTWR